MKIWVVTSGFEMLPLFKFLNKYDFEYHIYRDWNYWPYGDKGFDFSFERVQKAISYLNNKVDYIIVPPVYELFLWDNSKILPLFKNYLFEYCLKYSLVGKIWFLWDFSDIEVFQNKFEEISKDYKLTENQKSIKKFNFPFAIWLKEVGLWKYFLTKLWFRDWMVRQTIKHDLRYFKDAAVDTLVPLNWGFIAYEKGIKSKINLNKIRFYWINSVENIFNNIVEDYWLEENNYSIYLYKNWVTDILKEQKKWMWILQRWRKYTIQEVNIN